MEKLAGLKPAFIKDGTITAADRTTYAVDLDEQGRFTTSSGVTLQLLSVAEWEASASTGLLSQFTWPNGSKDSVTNNASDGSDYWTRDSGDVGGSHKVFSLTSVYQVSNDFSGYENALHFHAFKVI